ncbi:hypothetical protein HGRIS_004430 [Hohenbuehelia grisea]|uniref:C2H2-type domain-containing protein n=1 Tax=Hohenbuehelia grisea TaxID=104357 RepID=A0ABR3JC36_9AGAR
MNWSESMSSCQFPTCLSLIIHCRSSQLGQSPPAGFSSWMDMLVDDAPTRWNGILLAPTSYGTTHRQQEDAVSPLSVVSAHSFPDANEEHMFSFGGEEPVVQHDLLGFEGYVAGALFLSDPYAAGSTSPLLPSLEEFRNLSDDGHYLPQSNHAAQSPPVPEEQDYEQEQQVSLAAAENHPSSLSVLSSSQFPVGIPSATHQVQADHRPWQSTSSHCYPPSFASNLQATSNARGLHQPNNDILVGQPEHVGITTSGYDTHRPPSFQGPYLDSVAPSSSTFPSSDPVNDPVNPLHEGYYPSSVRRPVVYSGMAASPVSGGSPSLAGSPIPPSVPQSWVSSHRASTSEGTMPRLQPLIPVDPDPTPRLVQRAANCRSSRRSTRKAANMPYPPVDTSLPGNDRSGLYALHSSLSPPQFSPSTSQFLHPDDTWERQDQQGSSSDVPVAPTTQGSRAKAFTQPGGLSQSATSDISGSPGPPDTVTEDRTSPAPSIARTLLRPIRQTVATLQTRIAARRRRKNQDVPGKHICHICGQDLTTKINLTRHVRAHEGNDRPFKCPKCGNGFTTDADCKRHRKNSCKGSGDKGEGSSK